MLGEKAMGELRERQKRALRSSAARYAAAQKLLPEAIHRSSHLGEHRSRWTRS
jgi:hypothetical protein